MRRLYVSVIFRELWEDLGHPLSMGRRGKWPIMWKASTSLGLCLKVSSISLKV